MTKSMLAAAALLVATPALAAPAVRTVVGDNGPITYTQEALPDGTLLLASAPGYRGAAFRLLVRGNWVSGDVDGSPVSFRAPRPRQVRAVRAD